MLHQTVHENLPYQYQEAEEVASGYEALSKADIFFGRVKRTQNWGLLSYGLDQMSIGVAAAKLRKYSPAHYRFLSSRIMVLSRTKTKRRIRDDICTVLGSKCHVSRRRANVDILPFLTAIFRNDEDAASKFTSWLSLDKDMVAYLSGREPKPVARRGRREPAKRRRKTKA